MDGEIILTRIAMRSGQIDGQIDHIEVLFGDFSTSSRQRRDSTRKDADVFMHFSFMPQNVLYILV
jgi:hypothetical protein